MNENEFLQALDAGLRALDAPLRDEILRDYREHFAAAREAGRGDAETAARLGDPGQLAKGHVASERLRAVEKAPSLAGRSWKLLGLVKALLILAPLNFIVILGPFLVLGLTLLAGWSIMGGSFALALVLIGKWLVQQPALTLDFSSNYSVLLLFVGGACFALLGLLGMWVVSALTLRGLLRYFKWNLRFVRKEGTQSHV